MNRRVEVLVAGYGSAGKRHVGNLMSLGIDPYVLTRHPDGSGARFVDSIKGLTSRDIKYCIISSVTSRHLADFKSCLRNLKRLKGVLIEKPVESSALKGREIKRLAAGSGAGVFVAYNLRFLRAFDMIADFIAGQRRNIKIVEIAAGQDLREWRPGREIGDSYSAHRRLGGGVDLDLSHEIDYALWLFGGDFKKRFLYRAKISGLDIHAPDTFKLILDYRKFIVDITLDYIRNPAERYLKIICDNSRNLYYDLITGRLEISGKTVLRNDTIDGSYISMLRVFLGLDRRLKPGLCSLDQALDVLGVLGV